MKRIFTIVVSMLMLIGLLSTPATAFAANSSPVPLHQGVGPFDWEDYATGTSFGLSASEGALVPGYSLGTVGTVFWHFVNPDKLGGYADITFLDANGKEVTFKKVTSYKNGQHFGVITLQSWKLLRAAYYPAGSTKKTTLFNLSHTAGKKPFGALKVSVDAQKQHEEVTWQRYYSRDVQDFYSRDVQDFYSRDVQDFYSRDVQNFYQRGIYKRFVPVFEKKVSSNSTSTLTSWLSGNAGGKFNNGMVWLAIDVAKARTEGYTIGIAQSNPDNTYIGYSYNVDIVGEKLIISFDDKFIQTDIHAEVTNTTPVWHGNGEHKTLTAGGTLSLDMPAGYGGTVYLYVHLADGISWYTTGLYEFVEWRYLDTITGDYELVETKTGSYALIKTEIGEYTHTKTVYGDYNLIDTVYGEYALVDTQEVTRITVTDAYNVNFDLIVKDADGNTVFSGIIQNNGEVIIPNLLPGTYTAILSGADIGVHTKSAVVVASQTAQVHFDGITVTGDQVDIYLEDIKTDNKLPDVKTDNKLPDVKTDNKLPDVKTDNQLPDVYLPDVLLPDVKLGNETDPYHVNAIRLN